MPDFSHAPATHWDKRFSEWHQNGEDLDWGTQWTSAFLEPLRQANVDSILDIGCGSGNDVIRLMNHGFNVFGLNYSRVAIVHAAKKIGEATRFVRVWRGIATK